MDTDELRILLDNDLYGVRCDLTKSAGRHGLLHVDDDTGEIDVNAFYMDDFYFSRFLDEVQSTISDLVDEDLSDVDWDEIALDIASEY